MATTDALNNCSARRGGDEKPLVAVFVQPMQVSYTDSEVNATEDLDSARVPALLL